jgi:uncharacterized damage-inducible protein DinB
MQEIERIADQLKRAFEGGAWHGPAVNEALAEHDAASASMRVYDGGHTACELALHIAVWIEIGTQRAEGMIVTPTAAQDWPQPAADAETGWAEAQARVHSSYMALREVLAGMSDERLAETVNGKDHDVYVLLHGMIQHSLYHAGQVVLLRRAIEAGARA